MAMKKRDKIAVGLLLFAGSAFIILALAMPAWTDFSTNYDSLNKTQTDVASLQAQVTSLQTQIGQIQDNVPLPPNVNIPQFKGDNREQIVKDIIDEVVTKATDPGNKLIYLLPFTADPIKPSLTPEEEQKIKDGKMSEPVSPYDTLGYELAVRGTYGSIQDFLSAMEQQKDLVEIVSISLVNENGVDRAGTSTPSFGSSAGGEQILDPSKPIRLTAKLRLILERGN